jgi:hypothetical protein
MPDKEALQLCCNKHVFTSICTKHAIHREHGRSSAISNMEPSSGLLFSECPIFSAFTITVFYTVAFLLLLYFFAVPSYLPIHFTTAEFSASTGGSSSMALSPPRIRQLMPKTQSFFIFTSHGLFLLLLQCLVPPSYSSVFTLLPHEHSSRLVLTFPSVSY